MQRINIFGRLMLAISVLCAPMAIAETGVSGVRISPFPSGVPITAPMTSSERTLFTVVLEEGSGDATATTIALCAAHGCEMKAVRFEERSADLLMTTQAAEAIRKDARVTTVVPAAARETPRVVPNATTSSHDCGTGCWSTGTYRYDPAGNISSIGSETFRYDAANRLAVGTVLPPDGTTVTARYTYDPFGNIHASSLNSSASGLSSHAFSIDRESNRFFGNQYDAAGNVTRDASTSATMQWDGAGMMARYSGGRRSSYIYTANDERIATFDLASGGSPMRATWTIRGTGNNVLRVFESFGGANATDTWRWEKDYVHGPAGRLLASQSAGGVRHFHVDHLGSPRLITDEFGVKLAEHTYAPFGAEITDKSQDSEPMKFTGHERDFGTELGGEDLDYMHARFYSSRAARFLSVDPALDLKEAVHEPQMWNRYAYVTNNPLTYIDPGGKYRTFYKEKPMTAENLAMDENTPAVVKYSMYATGGLTAVGAGGLFFAGGSGGGLAAGAFRLHPIARGNFIETALATAFGGGLPRTFPVIDRFLNGVATSVKSMDLMSKTYQNANRLMSTLTGYVDKLANFSGGAVGQTVVRGGEVTTRVLEVVVQRGAANAQQMETLRKAAEYARQNNVQLKVIMVR